MSLTTHPNDSKRIPEIQRYLPEMGKYKKKPEIRNLKVIGGREPIVPAFRCKYIGVQRPVFQVGQ
jgi:hypothetical protein